MKEVSCNNSEIKNMGLLQGKVAIVTGASSGIGYATAKLFASEGASVVATARREGALNDLVQDILSTGGKAVAIAGDVRDETLARTLVDTAVDRFGGLDIAFNNAGGVGGMGPVSGLSLDGWREAIDTNLTSAFLGAKYQEPAMVDRGGGSIVFTSTFVGHTAGMPGMSAYAASKAGLIGLTQVLAAEYGSRNVRVNTVIPGGTDTPSNVANSPDATPELVAFVKRLHALKRLATPDEIARAVLFLASDASAFVTGSALAADGGLAITRT
jgi:NAD(P)-dependent dehydrogenase (short-subunit alcohol dehydrogenase family)